jgi:hypothetical protein
MHVELDQFSIGIPFLPCQFCRAGRTPRSNLPLVSRVRFSAEESSGARELCAGGGGERERGGGGRMEREKSDEGGMGMGEGKGGGGGGEREIEREGGDTFFQALAWFDFPLPPDCFQARTTFATAGNSHCLLPPPWVLLGSTAFGHDDGSSRHNGLFLHHDGSSC